MKPAGKYTSEGNGLQINKLDGMKRRITILLIVVLLIAALGSLCNKISYDPNFSMVDAMTGASKRKEREEKRTEENTPAETKEEWDYSLDRLALSEDDPKLSIVSVVDGKKEYRLLRANEKGDSREIVLLANSENADYLSSVQAVAVLLTEQGYTVSVRKYSETMFTSLAHAKKFDVIVIGEEVLQ